MLKKAQQKYPKLLSDQLIEQILQEKYSKLKLSPQATPKTENIILATPKSDELQPRTLYPRPKKIKNTMQVNTIRKPTVETNQVKTQLREIIKEEVSNSPLLRIDASIDQSQRQRIEDFRINSYSIEDFGFDIFSNYSFVYQPSSTMEHINCGGFKTSDKNVTDLK